MSDLIGNPNCWFSEAEAQIILHVGTGPRVVNTLGTISLFFSANF